MRRKRRRGESGKRVCRDLAPGPGPTHLSQRRSGNSASINAGPTLLLPRKTQAAPKSTLGPSTTTEPYLVPNVPGVKFTSILTVGDNIDGYRMVGIPDGLGA
jgi:hypothetical protein